MKQNMEIISMDVKAFDALAGHVEAIERKAEALCRRQEDVSLKKWLDNQDVCDVLGISKRTLQTYREKGLLPFSRIRHKIFYKPEDVGKLLQSSHFLIPPRYEPLFHRQARSACGGSLPAFGKGRQGTG